MARNILLRWWDHATPDEKRALAAGCDTSVAALHQAAHAYRTKGIVSLSPELARKIEIYAKEVPGRLPKLRREDLCPACAQCELAVRARTPR
jgi:hypothetical protein